MSLELARGEARHDGDSVQVSVPKAVDLKRVAPASGGPSISQAAISPDGKRAAFSDVRGLTLIDVASNSTRQAPLERVPGIAALTFNAPGDKLLLCTYDKAFVLSGEELDHVETIPLMGFGSPFAAFSADGQIVARYVSSKIELWDLGQKRLQASFPGGALPGGLALSADGQRVYFGADKDNRRRLAHAAGRATTDGIANRHAQELDRSRRALAQRTGRQTPCRKSNQYALVVAAHQKTHSAGRGRQPDRRLHSGEAA